MTAASPAASPAGSRKRPSRVTTPPQEPSPPAAASSAKRARRSDAPAARPSSPSSYLSWADAVRSSPTSRRRTASSAAVPQPAPAAPAVAAGQPIAPAAQAAAAPLRPPARGLPPGFCTPARLLPDAKGHARSLCVCGATFVDTYAWAHFRKKACGVLPGYFGDSRELGDVPVASCVCAADGGPALVVRPVGPFELWCCAAAHVRSVSGGDLEVKLGNYPLRLLPLVVCSADQSSCSLVCAVPSLGVLPGYFGDSRGPGSALLVVLMSLTLYEICAFQLSSSGLSAAWVVAPLALAAQQQRFSAVVVVAAFSAAPHASVLRGDNVSDAVGSGSVQVQQ